MAISCAIRASARRHIRGRVSLVSAVTSRGNSYAAHVISLAQARLVRNSPRTYGEERGRVYGSQRADQSGRVAETASAGSCRRSDVPRTAAVAEEAAAHDVDDS